MAEAAFAHRWTGSSYADAYKRWVLDDYADWCEPALDALIAQGWKPRTSVETPEAAVEAMARVLRYHIRDDTLQWYEHIARAVVDAIEAAGWTPPGSTGD